MNIPTGMSMTTALHQQDVNARMNNALNLHTVWPLQPAYGQIQQFQLPPVMVNASAAVHPQIHQYQPPPLIANTPPLAVYPQMPQLQPRPAVAYPQMPLFPAMPPVAAVYNTGQRVGRNPIANNHIDDVARHVLRNVLSPRH